MRSATDFLPWRIIEFMNLEITKSLNFGSGLTSRLSALCRRDMCFLPQPQTCFIQLHLGPPCAALLKAAVGGDDLCKKAHYLGLLAPYLERLCFRSATPWVSSTPRMM